MKNYLFYIVIFCFSPFVLNAQWRSTDIPDSLKRNADAVLRHFSTEIRILGVDKKIKIVNEVITVLNEQGKDYADLTLYYDKDVNIEFVKGILYNDLGVVVKKCKRGDFQDVSVTPNYTLFSDDRMLYTNVVPSKYPFTVEYEYRIVEDNILSIPAWYPQYGYRLAVENATLKVCLADSNLVRFKSLNIALPKKTKEDDFSKVLTWNVKSVKAIEKEPFSPRFYEYQPVVFIAPQNFIYKGFSGSMQSWATYGDWVNSLLDGRQNLTSNVIEEIKKITLNVPDLKERVRIIYKYLQAHTRYVGVQVGIGGFQPFPASDVEKYGYGDCKALTNYAMALLSVAGVKSFYCEIGVDNARISFKDFPSISQTDHALLCVPCNTDTIWLECTNQNIPFGYVSYVKQNQKAILVDGKSSKLVSLPKIEANNNIQNRILHIRIDSIGNATGNLFTSVKGGEVDNLMPEIWSSKKDQAEIIQKKYKVPGIVFTGFDYKVEDVSTLQADEKVSFAIKGFASQTGKRLFIPFNSFIEKVSVPAKSKNRLTDVSVNECYTHIDTIDFVIPINFAVEFIPKGKQIVNLFGSYSLSISTVGNRLTLVRRYVQNRSKYLSTEYNNFVDFLTEVSRIDKQSIVLVSK